jgi:hypothetical protein
MTNAKKNSSGAREVSTKGKADTKGNGKIIPFRSETGKFRKQEQGQEDLGKKKLFSQIEIQFPSQGIQDGDAGKTTEFKGYACGNWPCCSIGIRLGPGCTKDCPHQKGEKELATKDQ